MLPVSRTSDIPRLKVFILFAKGFVQMALNGMNSGSVRFSKTAPGPSAFQRPVKKVDNFFDEDDEGQLGFETI